MEKFLAILAKQKRFLIGAALVLLVILGLTTNAALNKGEFTWPENTLEFIRLPDYKVAKITVTEAENKDFYKFDIAFDNQNASASADVQWSLEINGDELQAGYGSFHGNPKALIHGAPKKEVCSGGKNFGSVKFILDPENKIKEKNEDNNKFEVGISCGTGTVAMPAKAPLTAAPVKPENQTATAVVTAAPVAPPTYTANAANLQATFPANNAAFQAGKSVVLRWTGGDENRIDGKYLNYRWKVMNEKGEEVYGVNWHETAKFPTQGSYCHSKDGQDWTCGHASIPAGKLSGGKYTWFVEAGDGVKGFGYTKMGTFTVGKYFGDGSPMN